MSNKSDLYIQFNANQMNKSRARIELYKLYTDPAFIHLVCIKLYITNQFGFSTMRFTYGSNSIVGLDICVSKLILKFGKKTLLVFFVFSVRFCSSIRPFVHPSIRPSVCLSICLFVHLSVLKQNPKIP